MTDMTEYTCPECSKPVPADAGEASTDEATPAYSAGEEPGPAFRRAECPNCGASLVRPDVPAGPWELAGS